MDTILSLADDLEDIAVSDPTDSERGGGYLLVHMERPELRLLAAALRLVVQQHKALVSSDPVLRYTAVAAFDALEREFVSGV